METLDLAAAPVLSAFAAVLAVSLLSLVGAATFLVRRDTLDVVVPYLVSIAVGAMLGNAFFHLIPETAAAGFGTRQGATVLGGMLLFFLFERFIGWHEHGHSKHARVAPYAWLNLAGDGLHNFADGIILAAAWVQGPAIGLPTTIAVALHEIPQELGDVGILLSAKLSRGAALALNLGSALLSLIGCAVGLVLGSAIEGFQPVVLGLTAGGFIYVAAADLMPELHRERRGLASILQVACVIAGIATAGIVG